MTLSREEIAVRLAASLLTGYASRGPVAVDRNRLACDAIHYADGLLLALPPTPTPVAPPAGKYEPRVGDVVRFKDSTSLWVVDGKRPSNPHFTVGITDTVHWSRGCCNPDELTYVRPSTDAEKRAAGLAVPPPAPTPAPEVCCASPLCPHSSPGGGTSQVGGAAERDAGIVTPASPTPAPEAKRPEWVRVTGFNGWDAGGPLTVGRVYRVTGWEGSRPRVTNDIGERDWYLSDSGAARDSVCVSFASWEPAPCPPPVEGSEESEAERVARVAAIIESEMYVALDSEVESKWSKYAERAARAVIAALSRPVRP